MKDMLCPDYLLCHLASVMPLPFKPYFEHSTSFSNDYTQTARFLHFSINR